MRLRLRWRAVSRSLGSCELAVFFSWLIWAIDRHLLKRNTIERICYRRAVSCASRRHWLLSAAARTRSGHRCPTSAFPAAAPGNVRSPSIASITPRARFSQGVCLTTFLASERAHRNAHCDQCHQPCASAHHSLVLSQHRWPTPALVRSFSWPLPKPSIANT